MVVVNDKNNKQITNSVREGHRLGSIYVLGDKNKRTDVGEVFEKLDGGSQMADMQSVIEAIFKYDVNSLLHGVWLSQIGKGRIRITRALSGFIEAHGISEVISGGVKRDHVTGSTKDAKSDSEDDEDAVKDASTGRGSIPFSRIEYTAEDITANFNLDLDQIKNYGLDDDKTQLLEKLALYKIRNFVDSPFRPRTACDLEIADVSAESDLPSLSEITKDLSKLIDKCGMSQHEVKYDG